MGYLEISFLNKISLCFVHPCGKTLIETETETIRADSDANKKAYPYRKRITQDPQRSADHVSTDLERYTRVK